MFGHNEIRLRRRQKVESAGDVVLTSA